MKIFFRQSVVSGLLAGVLLFAMCLSAEAQQQAKIPKIGWLGIAASGGRLEFFRRELRELGYVEHKNIVFEVRTAENKLERLQALAEELLRLPVDVLVVPSTSGALAAKNTGSNTPIVFIGSGDPVAAGLVGSFSRPGGNITGFTTMGAMLAGKQLEIIKETVPGLLRAAVLWNSHDPTTVQQWKESQAAAKQLHLQLHSLDVKGSDHYKKAFHEAVKTGSGSVSVTHSAPFVAHQRRIAALAIENRIPAIYPRGDFAQAGGLMSYGVDETEPYKRTASLLHKILKGAKPADLPVEQPTKFELVVNLKTAKQIGLTIPPNVLARADRVIR